MPNFASFPVMGNNLKILRKTAKLTQEEAADAMGVSKGQFIKLERGERRLTLEYITRAAKAFKVSVADVIEEGLKEGGEQKPAIPVRPELAVRIADLFARVVRLHPDRQAQIADLVEEHLDDDQGNLRETITKQVS